MAYNKYALIRKKRRKKKSKHSGSLPLIIIPMEWRPFYLHIRRHTGCDLVFQQRITHILTKNPIRVKNSFHACISDTNVEGTLLHATNTPAQLSLIPFHSTMLDSRFFFPLHFLQSYLFKNFLEIGVISKSSIFDIFIIICHEFKNI